MRIQRETQIPFGNDRKKGKSNSKDESRSFAALRMTMGVARADAVAMLSLIAVLSPF
jgi:hypothetical protein